MPVMAAWSFLTTSEVAMSWGCEYPSGQYTAPASLVHIKTNLVHDARGLCQHTVVGADDNKGYIPEDDLLIVGKTTSKLVPEMHKLLGGSSIGLVAANNSSTARLLAGVVVSIRLH